MDAGDKEIILIMITVLWSALFLCCSLVCWWRDVTLRLSALIASISATVLSLVTLVGLHDIHCSWHGYCKLWLFGLSVV
jgi:hypothetical protein